MRHTSPKAAAARLAVLAAVIYAIAVHALLAGAAQAAMAAAAPGVLCLSADEGAPLPAGAGGSCCDTLCKSVCANGAADLPAPGGLARPVVQARPVAGALPERVLPGRRDTCLPRPRGPPAAA
ncbi:hypothetical protein FDP22_22100 (plasmid) [Paroceanicella profunda]|uniref:DUF2946 domain-containing protein n=1 Tax=Paroceanicella profunda TaxID=2579971 RepID=A0A5B8G3N5_9RHOB|nr:hypothetical protein [Paroceanicella profunda]QDL94570.1 hypothetical protein FDP22_22100 [Paroceanicella profunda]